MNTLKVILLIEALSGLLMVIGYVIARRTSVMIAHELSHIKHKDIMISTMATTIACVVVMLSRWAVFFGGNDDNGMIKTIAVAVIATVTATLIQMAISRSREYEADAGAAMVSGKPEALAGALTKLSLYAKRRPMDANPSTAHMFIVNLLSG